MINSGLLHQETTKLEDLPKDIFYLYTKDKKPKIKGFIGSKYYSLTKKVDIKIISIDKHGIKEAYIKALKYTYGNDYSKVLKEYPIPNIHPDDLFKKELPYILKKNYLTFDMFMGLALFFYLVKVHI